MIQFNETIQRLQQDLLLLPHSKQIATPSELACVRCPLCGDSPHPNSQHFYVGVKEIDQKQHIVYDCKMCSTSGMMTTSILHRLGINNPEYDEYIKSLRKAGYIRTFSNDEDISGLQYKYPKPTKEDAMKVEYISKRLGMDFWDYENIKKYRIVIHFSKFLQMNKITDPACSKKLIPLIDAQGVGFVSADKSVVSFRNIAYKEYEMERFNIIRLYQNIKRPFYYMPPVAVDILSNDPKIVISESSFNIINIQRYFYEDSTDAVLASASRKGFSRVIMNLIQKTGFVSGELICFCDNDKTFDIDYFEKILAPFQDTFNIKLILSLEGKDFGEQPANGINYSYKTIRL